MTVLVIGKNGQLGQELINCFKQKNIEVCGVGSSELNITDKQKVEKFINNRYSFVINTAAYTNVDKAENEYEYAYMVNCYGVENLAYICLKNNIPLIHISTDYVFDGNFKKLYNEDMYNENPINNYGISKLHGENRIRNILDQYIILRTSWIYGIYGNNFVKTMIRLAREKEVIKVVNDQFGCPTYSNDISNVIIDIVKQKNIKWGTYHYCNYGVISWYELASEAIEYASEYEKFIVKDIIPINSNEYKVLANRPKYTPLNCDKIKRQFGIKQIHWKDSLKIMIDSLYRKRNM
jgi:dTDP-4-dehydrorhamnose reductase